MKYCEDRAALLDAFVDGELSPDEMDQVQAHLDNCPGCRAYVDDALAIRAAFPQWENVQVPEGFAAGVMAAVAAAPQPAARPKKRAKKNAAWMAVLPALVACCAIVILLQNRVFQSRSSTDTAVTSTSTTSSGAVSTDTDRAVAESAAEPASRTALQAEDSGTADTEAAEDDSVIAYDSAADTLAEKGASAEDGWVEYGNVVFASVVFLTPDYVGDALDGYEGKPYSNANYPEDGVIGIGYALDQEDFEHILYDVLDYPLGPTLDQNRTTELNCIVVTENPDWH